MKEIFNLVLLALFVVAALALAWLDTVSIPVWLLLLFIFVQVVSWVRYRTKNKQHAKGIQLQPLPFLLIVASISAIGIFNPSHMTKPSIETTSQNDESPAAKVYVPNEKHLAAFPGTVNVKRTIIRTLNLIYVISLGAIIATLIRRNPKSISAIYWLITLHGVILAIVAYHYKSSGSELLLGRFETPNPRFYGPFRYNNYWVAWNILVAGTAIGLLMNAIAQWRPLSAFVATLSLSILVVSVFACESRSGILVTTLLILYLLAEIALPLLRRVGILKQTTLNLKKTFLWIFASATIMALAASIAITTTWDRWATQEYAETKKGRFRDTIYQLKALREGHLPDLRPAMARDTVKMALAKPVWGWGLGSFEYAFPMFAGPEFLEDRHHRQTKNFGKLIRPRFAHNDWAQYWAELGTIGFAALLLAIYLFIRPGIKYSTIIDKNQTSRPLFVSCAIVSLISLWDFPLNNLAVLSLFSLLLGLASTRQEQSENPFQPSNVNESL